MPARYQSIARLALALLALFFASPRPAAARQAPPTAPILRIETRRHTAKIGRIGVDRAGRYLVTASDDKTARVWDVRTGVLLRTLRPPVGDGDEGKLNAVAVTPDGATVACAGRTGAGWDQSISIYLFDRETGALKKRMTGLPNVIFDLAFSPDGRRLVAALGGKNGVRLFRADDGSLLGGDAGYANRSNGADFSPAGDTLATTCDDGYIRRYAVSDGGLRLERKEKAPGGRQPFDVRFSPDGTRLAVSYKDVRAVSVLSADTLAPRFAPDISGIANGRLFTVCWSADGRHLYAAGAAQDANGRKFLRRWGGGGMGAFTDLPAAADSILDLRAAGDGRVLWASSDPAWGVFDAAGKRVALVAPLTADFRGIEDKFRVEHGGGAVQFGFARFGARPARFDASRSELRVRGADTGKLFDISDLTSPPKTEADGLSVTDWKNNTAPKRNGIPLALAQYEMSRSLAVAPDSLSFLLGADYSVRCYDRGGTERWNVPVPGTAWGMNVSGDGKLAVAAFGDGTIRWYRMTDGKELLAFFPHNDGKRWVAWTPTGYYDCSPGGEELIGWHVNRGADQAADFFPASQFRDRFYRPDVVGLVLKAHDEADALALANDLKSIRPAAPVAVADILPPVLTLVSPANGASVSTGAVTLKYTIRAPAGAPVTTVRALVDGRPAETPRGLDFSKPAPASVSGEIAGEIVVTVPERDCEIALIATNKNAPSVPAVLRVRWAGAKPAAPIVAGQPNAGEETFVLKPKLYVLSVGVSKYAKPGRDLDFAAKDAQDFAAAMRAQSGGLYREVVVKVLTDADATQGDILDGFEWVQRETTAKDVAMVFLSGHGANDPDGDYHFLPQNFDGEKWKRTAVSFSDIQSTLKNIKGKALFFVDSCHSGNVLGTAKTKGDSPDIVRVVNELASADNGVVVFAASTGKQVALEDPEWNNGAFTKALVEALNGGADFNKTGRITINMLDLYISERVKSLTKGTQTPTTTKPATVADYPVAVKVK